MLDVILSDLSSSYFKPTLLPLIGQSDHCSVLWTPKAKLRPKKSNKLEFCPLGVAALNELGRWINNHLWEEVYKAHSTQSKVTAYNDSSHRSISSNQNYKSSSL